MFLRARPIDCREGLIRSVITCWSPLRIRVFIRRERFNGLDTLFLISHLQGILDMIVLSKVEKEDLVIHALKNNYEADAYFVKVIGEYEMCRLPSLATIVAIELPGADIWRADISSAKCVH